MFIERGKELSVIFLIQFAVILIRRLNLVPTALFPGFSCRPTSSKAREKRPGDEAAPGPVCSNVVQT